MVYAIQLDRSEMVMPVWIPFSDETNSMFESDRRLPLKLAGGAFVGLCIGLQAAYKMSTEKGLRQHTIVDYLECVFACVVLSTTLVLLLSLQDSVRNRIASGQPVHAVLRFLLASRLGSATMYLLLALVAALALYVLT